MGLELSDIQDWTLERKQTELVSRKEELQNLEWKHRSLKSDIDGLLYDIDNYPSKVFENQEKHRIASSEWFTVGDKISTIRREIELIESTLQ